MKETLVRFREGLLPIMQGRYLIDDAHFGGLRGEGWGIDGMTLFVKGGRRSTTQVNHLHRPSPFTPNYVRVKRGEDITGWFNRALEVHKESFFKVSTLAENQ